MLSNIINEESMCMITKEFQRIGDKCYLDNAGTSLYPQCLVKLVNEDLMRNLYMNPHSDKYTNNCIDQIRSLILTSFNTDSTQYTVIFTSGTTSSLKLIADAFQFTKNNDTSISGSFMYLAENHTSVIGMREVVKTKKTNVMSMPRNEFLKSLKDEPLVDTSKEIEIVGNSLFVYPAQSNFNGYKYPLNIENKIRSGCLNKFIQKEFDKTFSNWYVLLDAAALLSTSSLDLSENGADFICMSFYKIFGFPTGLGALLVKNNSGHVLSQKKYFGGGSVDVVLCDEDYHVKKDNLSERFEDGTVSFLSIMALKQCFDSLNSLIPKIISNNFMDTVSYHTYYLAKDFYQQLKQLQHPNGCKAAVLYLDSNFESILEQGPIVAFNLVRADQSYIGYAEFQHMADLFNINVRTGCFCNSGTCQRHLGLSNQGVKDMYKAGHKCGDDTDLIFEKPTGCVRVSFGYYNTYEDVDKVISMICKCFVTSSIIKPNRNKYIPTISKPLNETADKKTIQKMNGCIIPENNSDWLDKSIKLNKIAIFPIKSCGAFKINSEWMIDAKGFEYDRHWMIVRENGVCLTQKQTTRMCLIRPEIKLGENILVLRFEDKTPISVPLKHYHKNMCKNVSLCHSKVCNDMVQGIDCGDDVADWISEALEISFLRLIRQSQNDHRMQKQMLHNDKKLLSLSNQAQFLLINRTTVEWLNNKIRDSPFSDLENLIDRFRGNLVIETVKELEEKEWDQIIIGKHLFKVEGLCSRCQMVCIDQDTGNKTVEPLRTISEEFKGKIKFGIYLSYIGTTDGSTNKTFKVQCKVKATKSIDQQGSVF